MTAYTGNDTSSRTETSDFLNSSEMQGYERDYPFIPYFYDSYQIASDDTSKASELRLGGEWSKSVDAVEEATSFKSDFYYRIHILPQTLNVGILAEEKTYEVELWNAWLVDKTLDSVSHSNIDGIDIVSPGATPLLYKPLQSQIYNYTLERQGPVTIDAVSVYDFTTEEPQLSITGFRAQFFGFEPNWNRLIDRFEWKTDVLRAHSGKEQRVKRRNIPRRHYEYDLTVSDRKKRQLEAILWGWQANIFVIPIWQDTDYITSSVAQNSTSVSVDTENMSYEADGRAVLLNDDDYEVIEIETVNASSLTLKSETLNAWAEDTKIIPVFVGRLSSKVNLKRFTGDVDYGIVQFTGEKSTDFNQLSGESEYRSVPVLEMPTLWNSDPQITWQPVLDTIDYGGVITVDEITDNNESLFSFSLAAKDRSEITWLKQFFYTRQGKLKPLWLPSGVIDLVVVDPIGSVDVNLIIENIDYNGGYAMSINKRDIRIELTDGTIFYRRITDTATIDNDTEQLAMDSALGIDIAADEIEKVSFMSLCRLDSDINELSWFKHNAMLVNFNLRTINHDL